MPSTVYAGGVGCVCCGGVTPCDNCHSCPDVDASEYCFCITKIKLTPTGSDCPSVEYTLDPSYCAVGTCSNTVVFNPPDSAIYKFDGLTLFLSASGTISCQLTDFAVPYYVLGLSFDIEMLDGCTYGFNEPSSDIQSTEFEADPCDIDSLLGTYTASYLDVQGALDITLTLSKGGTCPP